MSDSWTMRLLAPAMLTMACATPAQSHAPTEADVVRHHAAWCHQLYSDVLRQARAMHRTIEQLCRHPGPAELAAARKAWLAARQAYGQTEALRFHDGPIERLEPLLNAWPVDEAYIDYVRGRDGCGIVNDVARFPSLGATILELANERGGEANICVGWHAIEFMLWGQDLSERGPGERPWTDFAPTIAANGKRRCEYLRTISSMLVRHLDELARAWAPGAPYRTAFERDVDASVRRMLVGVTVLTAFELGGERLVVAYETRDQEQEHSCFSDSTLQDLVSNQLGIMAVVLGCDVDGRRGPGLVELVRDRRDIADEVERALRRADQALRAIPAPFDRALLGEDGSRPRRALRRAIESLEQQAEVLLVVGRQLGHELPLQPGD
ncbi:MAG: iron-regulated protein [Planctomycetes bacterium]|nr:iron-regulated protein [Planctomycetota bacterium]